VYEILTTEELAPVTKLFEVRAPAVAHSAQAGQFVIIRVGEAGERIPLTIADYDRERGTITLVVQEVGKTTMQLGTLQPGDHLASFTGPLGKATEIENYGTVLCVGGGVGIAPIYPIARDLRQAGNTVLSIIGARNKDLLFWEDAGGRPVHRPHLGHRPGHHDEVLCPDYAAFWRADHRQPQLDHG